MEALNTDSLVSSVLCAANVDLANGLSGDCVLINSTMAPPLDDRFRVVIEELRRSDTEASEDHLVIVLQTYGGHMEIVERLVAVMRSHYDRVSFIIPNFAYSAGTVLALSGDEIFMDYYSVLGPIDPQYADETGANLSGYGVLAKFREICKTINAADDPNDCRAEQAFLVKNFDPGQLFQFEQAIEHGKSLITEWLQKYKFKNWTKSSSTGKPITDEMRRERAGEVADILGDASRWHSHGRGITMSDLRLKINDYGADPELSNLIRNYHGLAVDYFAKLGLRAYIHSHMGTERIA